jgi:hypothetical protein
MENIELKQLVKLLDKVISSDNPETKSAFRELLIVAALTGTNDTPGFLENIIFSEFAKLEKEVEHLRREVMIRNTDTRRGKSYYDQYYTSMRGTAADPYSGRSFSSSTTDELSPSSIDWMGIMKAYQSAKK